jgi:hypothetical protein
MGELRKRVEEKPPEVSEADAAEIREWEARIAKNAREGWNFGTENIVNFDIINKRCWASEEYIIMNGHPVHRHCIHNEQTDIGLCKKHYEEIVGPYANARQKS